MKKIIWIGFGVAIIGVNLVAWLTEMATGFHIEMIFRITLIMGITVITTIFTGAYFLVGKFEEERPLTGYTDATLQDQEHQKNAQAAAQSNANKANAAKESAQKEKDN